MLASHCRLERFDYLDFLPKRPQGTTKILGTSAFAGTKTPAALKFSSKDATTDCAETPVNCPYISGLRAARTAGGWPTKHLPAGRRAGRSDWAERRFRRQPFILLSFSSSKKLRKAQETQSYQRFQHIVHTVFNTSGTAVPRSLSRVKVGTHTRLSEKDRTQRITRRNRGRFGWGGGITTLGAFRTFRKPCVTGYQNGVLCRFWALVWCAPEERREPAGQRCA